MTAKLKRIPVRQARLGMFLHALEGPWMDHPFWKSSFVLRDIADLQKLRASAVAEVWIDTARGLDVATDDGAPGVAPRRDAAPRLPARDEPAPPAPPAASPPPAPQARTSMQEELVRAAKVCQQSREVMSGVFAEARLGQTFDTARCGPLVDEITHSVFRNPGALVSLARLKTADDYTYMHSVAVCALMVSLGRQLGLDDDACREAGMAGLLHDLGKAAMPLEVLNKPDRLTDEEFAIIRTHPAHGHAMLLEARGASEGVLDVCLHHHEKFDGSGYPQRLAGEAISLVSRMGAVCDVYDAVTSNRPYKAGWDPADSIARMASWKGHFDPAVFHAFVRSLGIYPNGALVRLESQRLAVVQAQNAGALTKPVVKVFFDVRTELPVRAQEIDLATHPTERIVDREPLDRWQFGHLDALWAGAENVAAARGARR